MISRLSAQSRGHVAAMSDVVAVGPSSVAVIDQSDSPGRTTWVRLFAPCASVTRCGAVCAGVGGAAAGGWMTRSRVGSGCTAVAAARVGRRVRGAAVVKPTPSSTLGPRSRVRVRDRCASARRLRQVAVTRPSAKGTAAQVIATRTRPNSLISTPFDAVCLYLP